MHQLKQIQVKIFGPLAKRPVCRTFTAGKKRAFTQQGVEQVLAHLAERTEQLFPSREFRLVQIGPGQFNLIDSGERLSQ